MFSKPTTSPSESLKFGPPEQATIGVMLLVVVCVWTYEAGKTAYYTGDYMIGFSPAILAYPILVWGTAALVLWSVVIRKWLMALFCFISLSVCGAVYKYGSLIPTLAWERSIAAHDEANAKLLRDIGKCHELHPDDWSDISNEQKLTSIAGFQWYMPQHIAAPDGLFRGFSVAGVNHVRVQKVRHGWRGIALIENPSDLDRLTDLGFLQYQRCKASRWVTWSMK